MKKCCIVLLTICCILLTTACKDKGTVNTDTKNTSSVSSEEEGNDIINSQEPSNTEEETTETSSEDNSKETTATGSQPTHQHSYASTVTKEATCASTGTKKYLCSCGNSYTETIAKTSHNYSSATCTSAKKCTVCGATSGEALGHNYSNGYCTRCNIADPKPKKTLNIPSLPLTIKYLGSGGYIFSTVNITDISYEFSDWPGLTIYFSGEKTYDSTGNNGNKEIWATLKLYDSEGYVVANGHLRVENLKVGEKFRNREAIFFNIPENISSLTLEITDCSF